MLMTGEPNSRTFYQASASPSYLHEHLEVENVKITPKELVFPQRFESKRCEERITITNIGVYPVLIRILDSGSSCLVYEINRNGTLIAPGLHMVIVVRFLPQLAGFVNNYKIPIAINSRRIKYRVYLREIIGTLETNVNVIDFGMITLGLQIYKKYLKVSNSGAIAINYSIDMGNNDTNIIVEPMRGLVEAYGQKTLSIKIIPSKVGQFSQDLWIVCETPIYVRVLGNVINASIEPVMGYTCHETLVIKFPTTCYGSKSVKMVDFRNTGTAPANFSILCEVNGNEVDMETARSICDDFKFFEISPYITLPSTGIGCGILTFCPVLPKVDKDFFMIHLVIRKIHFEPVDASHYNEITQNTSMVSINRKNESGLDEEIENLAVEVEPIDDESYKDYELRKELTIHLLLYGEVDLPTVTAIPDSIILKNLILKETITRIIELKNESKKMPINFKYRKIAFIDVVPKMGTLKPLEALQLSVYVTPKSYDKIHSRIEFEILQYCNRDVNKSTYLISVTKVEVILEEQIIQKKIKVITARNFEFKKPNFKPNIKVYKKLIEEDCFIALPNDRPNNLLPWRSDKNCRTIYSAMPRIKFSPILKKERKDTISEEEEEEKKCYLWKYYDKCKKKYYKEQCNIKEINLFEAHKKIKSNNFIPLTNKQLSNIIVYERFKIIQDIAVQSSFEGRIRIGNNNDTSIRIYCRPSHPDYIFFPKSPRAILHKNTSLIIRFTCFTHTIGVIWHSIDLILNENHVIQTGFFVKICKRALQLNTNKLLFNNENLTEQLMLTNKLNTDIDFSWDIIPQLNILPLDGVVQAKKFIKCSIECIPYKCKQRYYEACLWIENKRKKICVQIEVDFPECKLTLPRTLNLGKIGLTTSKKEKLILKNPYTSRHIFKVENSSKSLVVSPIEGVLYPKSLQIFFIELFGNDEGNFSSLINIVIDGNNIDLLTYVKAEIVVPVLKFFPRQLGVKRIFASSFDFTSFTVKNNDEATAIIQFDINKFPELKLFEESNMENSFAKNNNRFIIKGGKSKQFFLHFYPIYVSMCLYPLPLIINSLPYNHPRLKIEVPKYSTRVLPHKILTKKWKYNFVKYIHQEINSVLTHKIQFKVSNVMEFTILVENLEPFRLNHLEGGCVQYKCNEIRIFLEPEEKISFLVYFEPENFGKFVIHLPIYIGENLETFHNYVTLCGEYVMPTMIPEFPDLCFGIIPLCELVEISMILTFKNHKIGCVVESFLEDVSLLNMTPTIEITSIDHSIKASYRFISDERCVLNSFNEFTCNCGMVYKMKCRGGAENCYLSNYIFDAYVQEYRSTCTITRKMSLSKSTNTFEFGPSITCTSYETVWPSYPKKTDYCFSFMEEVTKSIEEFIYSQLFKCEAYIGIPETLANYNFNDFKIDLPFYKILKKLNKDVNMKGIFNLTPQPPLFRVVYQFYIDVINFIKEYGAILPGVEPENFLPYEDYLKYMEEENLNPLDLENFHLLAKQSWIDLILQTYKIFIYSSFSSIIDSPVQRNSFFVRKESSVPYLRKETSVSNLRKDPATWSPIFSTIEMQIFDFFSKKVVNEMKKLLKLSNKTNGRTYNFTRIGDFSELNDGIAFIALTICFCPFMENDFLGIYVPAINNAQITTNICLLLEAWRKLHINYVVNASDILRPKGLKMLFLTQFLFSIFPSFEPICTLNYKTDLGTSTTDYIILKNDLLIDVTYKVIIFNNTSEELNICKNTITVPAQTKKFHFDVTYTAKFIKGTNAIIIFFPKELELKNISYTLIGIPILDDPLRFKLSVPLYGFAKKTIPISFPYKIKTSYDFYYITGDLKKEQNIETVPLPNNKDNILSIFQFQSQKINTDKSGFGYIHMTLWGLPTIKTSFYFIATNPNIGDILIEMIYKIVAEGAEESILIPNLVFYAQSSCKCASSVRCPCFLTIPIKARNDSMWKKIFEQVLNKDLNETDRKFWKSDHDTPREFNIKQELLKRHFKIINDDSISYLFNSNVKYEVTLLPNSVTGPKEFVIPNTLNAENVVNMTVHINEDVKIIYIKLKSKDNAEIRIYKIILGKLD